MDRVLQIIGHAWRSALGGTDADLRRELARLAAASRRERVRVAQIGDARVRLVLEPVHERREQRLRLSVARRNAAGDSNFLTASGSVELIGERLEVFWLEVLGAYRWDPLGYIFGVRIIFNRRRTLLRTLPL